MAVLTAPTRDLFNLTKWDASPVSIYPPSPPPPPVQVFDDGYNPKEQTGAFGLSKNLTGSGMSGGSAGPTREELGCVMYASNVLGSRGPRKMQVNALG